MTDSKGNVRFVENDGKWMWKRYDAEGSVIHRSEVFDTERAAREDYEENGGETASAESTSTDGNTAAGSDTSANTETETAPDQENLGAGSADNADME